MATSEAFRIGKANSRVPNDPRAKLAAIFRYAAPPPHQDAPPPSGDGDDDFYSAWSAAT